MDDQRVAGGSSGGGGEDVAAVCRRIRQRIPPPLPNHLCQESCLRDIQSEPALVRQGRISPSPFMGAQSSFPHVAVLGCRTIHVCTEFACTYWADNQDHTCPISGIEYGGSQTSSYNKNDSRTWYVRGSIEQAGNGRGSTATGAAATTGAAVPVAGPRAKPTMSVEQIEDRCTVMVKLLLYSRQRVSRNTQLQQEQTQAANLACATYLQKQAQQKQPPFFTDLYRIRAHLLFCEAPLQILEYDESRCRYYVAILSQIWQRVQQFYVRDQDKVRDAQAVEIVPRLDFESVVLATLYGMRQGYRQQGVRIIPQDAFLAQHLPLISDLITHFALPRDAITKGQKILRRAFENAFLDEVPVDQIELDSGALATAVPQVHEERIELDSRNNQVKITKSGERLFMLSSRKAQVKKQSKPQ